MKFKDLTIDSKFSYTFATVAFILGWVITIIGFFLPPTGEVSQSVCWVLGQSLAFSGGVCGITLHINNSIQEVRNEIKQNK